MTNDSISGAGADPYIITLNGDFYKIKNFDGYVRMLQGTYNNKLLTINVETSYSDENEKEELTDYLIKAFNIIENNNISLETLKNTVYNCPNEAFMRNIFLKYGEEEVVINMMDHQIVSNTSSFEIYNSDSKSCLLEHDKFQHYTDTVEKNLIVNINGLNIILSKYLNPQVRTSFHIQNPKKIVEPIGCIVKPLPVKNFKLDSLNNIEYIDKISTETDGSYVEEYYIDNHGNEKILKIDVL